jgi:hypothetical protein
MKKFFGLFAIVMLFSFITADSTITKEERKYALDYFKETRKQLLSDVKGLSQSQLDWKPADSVWSVAECIEHITITEKGIFDMIKGSLQQPADPSKRSEVKNMDEGVIQMISDRSYRVKTQDPMKPTGQFGNAQQTLEVYKQRRGEVIDFIKSTEDDLRNHYMDLPFGKIDAYQGLLFLAAHSKRHTLQIEEVMANAGFPKN